MKLFVKKILLSLLMLTCMTLNFNIHAEELDRIVVVVNDEPITERELNKRIQYFKEDYIARHRTEPNPKLLRQEVMDHLINRTLQMQLARQNNIDISDKEIDEAIKQFADNHKLSLDELKDKLKDEGQTLATFRKEIKEELIISKLQQEIVPNIVVTEAEVSDFIKKNSELLNQNKLYHIVDLKIELPDTPSSSDLVHARSEAEKLSTQAQKGQPFRTIVDNYKGDFTLHEYDLGAQNLAEIPDIFAKRVVHMKPGDLSEPILAPNGLHIIRLVDIKDQNASAAAVTQYHIRHILVKFDALNGSHEHTQQKIQAIQQKLLKGEDFVKIAKEYSQDSNSAHKGGDLGWIASGEIPELDQAINTLNVKQVSEPIKTSVGYHIVQVLAKREAHASRALERKNIQQMLYHKKRQEQVEKWIHKIRRDAYVKIIRA